MNDVIGWKVWNETLIKLSVIALSGENESLFKNKYT